MKWLKRRDAPAGGIIDPPFQDYTAEPVMRTMAARAATPAIADEVDAPPDDLRQTTGELAALLGLRVMEWQRIEGDESNS